MRAVVLLLCLLYPALPAWAGPSTVRQSVVYGEDDRVPAADYSDDRFREIARRSVVAIVDELAIGPDGSVEAESLGEKLGLCEGERFAELPSLARCTGVVVGEDLVMTAGHCMENFAACRTRVLVFDWRVEDGAVGPIDESNIYRCDEILTVDTRGYANLHLDYAVVRLDRPVGPERSAVVIREPVALQDEPVVLVSHPGGVPATIDDGGRVRDSRQGHRDFFVVDTDSFEGSSGGPVFDALGQLLGILVRGDDDYESDGDCRRVRVATEPVEEVTRVEWVLRSLCADTRHLGLCENRDACGLVCAGASCADVCVPSAPPAWTCVDEVFGVGDGCDCGCGVSDPDCESGYDQAYGCEVDEWCSGASDCTPIRSAPPSEWECNPARYSDGTCDCGCGASDADCDGSECAPGRPPEAHCASGGRPGAWLWPLAFLFLAALGRGRSCPKDGPKTAASAGRSRPLARRLRPNRRANCHGAGRAARAPRLPKCPRAVRRLRRLTAHS